MPSFATLEVPHRFGEPETQLAWIDAQLALAAPLALSAPLADLVVLPETALTGYVSAAGNYDLSAFAEPRDGATEHALIALARKHRCALLAPLVEREGAACFNSALFIDAEGAVLAHYRKRHPWMPETWATPGSRPAPLFAWRGLTLTIAICFDVHFLAEESGEALRAADVLLFPSAWTELGDTRPQMLPELAREFGCAIVNANWGRSVPRIPGQGQSLIVSARGEILASGGPLARAAIERRKAAT